MSERQKCHRRVNERYRDFSPLETISYRVAAPIASGWPTNRDKALSRPFLRGCMVHVLNNLYCWCEKN